MGVSGQDHRADKAEKRVENWALGHFAFGDQQEQLVKSGKTHQQIDGRKSGKGAAWEPRGDSV